MNTVLHKHGCDLWSDANKGTLVNSGVEVSKFVEANKSLLRYVSSQKLRMQCLCHEEHQYAIIDVKVSVVLWSPPPCEV